MLNYWKILALSGISMMIATGLYLGFEGDADGSLMYKREMDIRQPVEDCVRGGCNSANSEGITSAIRGNIGEKVMPFGDIIDGVVTCHNLANVYDISTAYRVVDNWQTVIGDLLYVYSAHADPRYNNFTIIRIFGIMSRQELVDPGRRIYYCQFEESRAIYVTEVRLHTLVEQMPPK
jgi:hypothetical protein